MTHQDPKNYWYVSECLSRILDNVGYSRKDVNRMVEVATEYEVFVNVATALQKSGTRMYMFGSRGEGSTGPGLQSDKDFLHQIDALKVVTNLNDCQPGLTNFFMVKDNFTHPGYVKLQVIYISPDYIPMPLYHMGRTNVAIATDALYRLVLPNSILLFWSGSVSGTAMHHPAYFKEHSSDNVPALRCSQWPREGYEWFQRRRFYEWPTPKQIENAWEYGCIATCVGHPHSYERHLEWRLSFSIAERDLTSSFEDTARKVYILLKLIKKTYIEPVVGDAFSSYHCKVCMLWVRERTPRELWSNENLLYCLILCIRQLHEWATTGFCPDYFIVTNNIYDRKIVGAQQFLLVQILTYLLSTDCRYVLGIKCCYLGRYLANRISGFSHISNGMRIWREVITHYQHMIYNACYCRHSILKYIPQHYSTLVDYIERIMHASMHLPYSMQYPLKHVMMVLWSQLGFHIVTVSRKNARCLSSEIVNCLTALASGCLSLGINSDATSQRLKLCGLGMELGNYDLTEVCLRNISDYLMRYMYSATVDVKSPVTVLYSNIVSCVEKGFTKRYSTEELLQTQVSFSVVYIPSEISITPTPLRMEMFRSIGAPPESRIKLLYSCYDWDLIDSLMCLYFFQYLNFIRQGKHRHKKFAIDNIIHVIRTEPQLLHRDTALNLLGYSFMQENQLTNAFICFTQSLKILRYCNAAKFCLGLLFKRVYVTKRRHVHCGSRITELAS